MIIFRKIIGYIIAISLINFLFMMIYPPVLWNGDFFKVFGVLFLIELSVGICISIGLLANWLINNDKEPFYKILNYLNK